MLYFSSCHEKLHTKITSVDLSPVGQPRSALQAPRLDFVDLSRLSFAADSDAMTLASTCTAAVRRANPPPTILKPPGRAFERRARVHRRTRVGESIIGISRKSIHPERQDKAQRCARDAGEK
ncbi:hypothetical protein QTP88_014892 [Uroleucon formosanum]